MPRVHIEVFDTKDDANVHAAGLTLPPLSLTNVNVYQADDLEIKIPGNNPLIVVRQNKFVVVAIR